MRRLAPPGLRRLDSATQAKLREFTKELLAIEADAAPEHRRFLGIRHRGLTLPEAALVSRLKDATVLVTGGTGCIGATLMAEIEERHPRYLISVSRGVTVGWPRVESANYCFADLRDSEELTRIVRKVRPDLIFHVAAQRDPGLAESEVRRTITTNVLATRNVLTAATAAGVSQVVFASTGKALRPYSPEIYTASKRAGEWLMAEAAGSTAVRCSGARFTHIVDNSIVYQRLLAWAVPGPDTYRDQVVRLHSPDIYFYAQSAREAAQLLLCACADAVAGEFRVQAITNLGLPLSLLDLALGTLGSTHSTTPIYFGGYDAGYEQVAFPGLYDPLTAGDVSPLLNAFEAAATTPSASNAVADSFRLEFAPDRRLGRQLAALEAECDRGSSKARLQDRLDGLSWMLLDSALRRAPRAALERSAAQARRYRDTMTPAHRRMLQSIEGLIDQ